MILALQVLAILLCIVGIVYQAAGLRCGTAKNRNVLGCFALALPGLIISIPAVQVALDAVLLGGGYANLLLRMDLYALFALMGYTILEASGHTHLSRLVMGDPGGIILSLFMGVTLVSFFLSNNLQDKDSMAFMFYVIAWRGQMAFVGFVLLAVTLPRVFSPYAHPVTRISSTLYSLAFTEVVAMLFVAISQYSLKVDHYDVLAFMMYLAAVLCALGAMVALLAGWMSRRKHETDKLA